MLRTKFSTATIVFLLAAVSGCGENASTSLEVDELSLAKGGNRGGNGGGEDPAAVWTVDHDIVITADVGSRKNSSKRIYVSSSSDPFSFVEIYNTNESNSSISRALWTPDGNAVTFGAVLFDLGISAVFAISRQTDGTPGPATHLFDVNTASNASPMVSPDGSRIAYTDQVGDNSQVFIRQILNPSTHTVGAPVQITNVPDGAATQTWASDSRRLVAREIITFSCEHGTCWRGVVAVYDLDPDGNGLVDQIDRTDVNSDTPHRNVTGLNPDWSPVAERVAVFGVPIGGGPNDLHLFDFSDPSAVAACNLTNSADEAEFGAAFSSDGTQLLVNRTGTDAKTSINQITLGAAGVDGCPTVLSNVELIPTRVGGKISIRYREIDWR